MPTPPRPRVRLNRGVEAQLLAMPVVVAAAKEIATKSVTQARALARAEAHDSGDYERGINVVVMPNMTESGVSSAVRIAGQDWKSGFVEYGTVHMPPERIIGRGIEQAGYPIRATRTHKGRASVQRAKQALGE